MTDCLCINLYFLPFAKVVLFFLQFTEKAYLDLQPNLPKQLFLYCQSDSCTLRKIQHWKGLNSKLGHFLWPLNMATRPASFPSHVEIQLPL